MHIYTNTHSACALEPGVLIRNAATRLPRLGAEKPQAGTACRQGSGGPGIFIFHLPGFQIPTRTRASALFTWNLWSSLFSHTSDWSSGSGCFWLLERHEPRMCHPGHAYTLTSRFDPSWKPPKSSARGKRRVVGAPSHQ